MSLLAYRKILLNSDSVLTYSAEKWQLRGVSPEGSFVPPKADCFPSYPIHTKENQYTADKKDDTEDDCEKNFNSAASISGGIATISCNHKITKERDPKKNYEYLDICPN